MPLQDGRYRQLRHSRATGWFPEDVQRDHEALWRARLERLGIRPPARVLEIGCGAGNTAAWLHEQGFDVTGIDLSSEAVAWARERVPDASFHLASATDLSNFADRKFDVILDSYCSHCLVDGQRKEFLREAHRVLAHGGHLLLACSIGPPPEAEWPLIGFDPTTRTLTMHGEVVGQLLPAAEILVLAQAAGFRILRDEVADQTLYADLEPA